MKRIILAVALALVVFFAIRHFQPAWANNLLHFTKDENGFALAWGWIACLAGGVIGFCFGGSK